MAHDKRKRIYAAFALLILAIVGVTAFFVLRLTNISPVPPDPEPPKTEQPKAEQPDDNVTAPVSPVALFQDVRGGFRNDSNLRDKGPISEDLLRSLTYNEKTQFPDADQMPANLTPERLMEEGKNPGLGVRDLHKSGVTGKGVNVGIIDQPLILTHPEFDDKIAEYKDFNCESEASMHGPAVASLLVGNTIGTAPDARVYYAATPSWLKDSQYFADALDWLVEVSAGLPEGEKIRVVSVSAAPSGEGSPFEKNNERWDQSVQRATDAGILVLDCTSNPDHGFITPAYLDYTDRESPEALLPGFPDGSSILISNTDLYVPTCPRTLAEQYWGNDPSYQYNGMGGLSWAIPYASGVLAMGWQVQPDYTPEQMVSLLMETASVKDGAHLINPPAFIAALQAAK